jgi:hypothetical protein
MLTRLTTIVPLLLCPLLMLACMWAMRGMGNRKNWPTRTRVGQNEVPTAARVAQLERDLAQLRGQLPEAAVPAENPSTSQPDRPRHVRLPTPVSPS